MSQPLPSAKALDLARQVLRIEAAAVLALSERLDGAFLDALALILNCRGRVVVSGIGKSGHIGRKLASTLASTGTPAYFVHPAEASHGDLGMITRDDVLIALSNSGESAELLTIVPIVKRQGGKLISMTGNDRSSLALAADVHLDAAVAQEACPFNLAPTASTTAALAMGDALAVALLDARGFGREDFARSHPGGSLGRKLLTHVRDVMRSGDAVPRVSTDTGFFDVMREMSAKGIGCTSVVDESGRPIGVFTDGDLRRLIERGTEVRQLKAIDLMHGRPRTVNEADLAVEAADLMERAKIHNVLVVDGSGLLVGALTYNDLLSTKVI